ncbi:MAG: tRNA uridine-5-carboxymethylaminomethyl(34) synthesis GTPase MnmE [Lentisphaerae bacterium]|nr:tRNA uridine-5-carboxymethylaminomethyl(34) synthesis GTPase MnmE [Lentisphaerota bacterium]
MNQFEDSICAPATALGGALSIIRISGPDAIALAAALWRGRLALAELPARYLALGSLHGADGSLIDRQCLAVRMPGPHSYTGEDMVELHCHGGALALRLTLQSLQTQGCRLAEPGEFTKRAFLNGKLDLSQAEAVAELISAGSEKALNLANAQLEGSFGRQTRREYKHIMQMLVEIESRLDFPEEDLDLDWLSPQQLQEDIENMARRLEKMAAGRRQGEILRHGISLVIAGPPNVGKSSLLNAILGQERAIVSELPGTTRDSIEAGLSLRGIPIRLIDTAGLRRGGDPIERIGMQRSRNSMAAADIIFWVMDASLPLPEQLDDAELPPDKVIYVANKMDRLPSPPPNNPGKFSQGELFYTCALDGTGLEELYEGLEARVWQGTENQPDEFCLSARHADCLQKARLELLAGAAQLEVQAWELAAANLRLALAQVGEITGEQVSEQILQGIFAKFCIGK